MNGTEGQLVTFPSHSPDRLLVGLPLMKREDRPENLAEWTRRVRNDLGLSLLDVERQSARGGQKISGGYINRIENGLAENPSPVKLKALARGLGLPEEEVFAKVGGRAVKSTAPTMTLSQEEMKLVLIYQGLSPFGRENLSAIAHTLQRSEQKTEAKKKKAS